MGALNSQIRIPDLWQQRAVNLLAAGHDVIIDAPTGSGKTFVFELLVEQAVFRRCIYTVPTRALANDKFREWSDRGWRVGIETGDLSYRTDAPVVVATLETQKRRLLKGIGPQLLVIDEYQMLGDRARGLNYELAMAMAPAGTRLLLLSGSVANPGDVRDWLVRAKRPAELIRHPDRPVPLEEPMLDALPQLPARSPVQGRWPRYLARALAAGLGPVLVFAPRRKAAEALALQLARQLEERDAIALTPEQKNIAGRELTACLKQRIAFHHSGMSYAQRAALVEPLAKANQLKIIVATTGLAAGINFAMRSVLISDNEYRQGESQRRLRPDELLQMFGRAGRRGLDHYGYALHTSGTPRLADARPLHLKRDDNVDWPSLITVLQLAAEEGRSPLDATRELTRRLFSPRPIALGLDNFLHQRKSVPRPDGPTGAEAPEQAIAGGSVREFLNSAGIWERKRGTSPARLSECWLRQKDEWIPALASPRIPASLRLGRIWKRGEGGDRRYGLKVALAHFVEGRADSNLLLAKWLRKAVREQERASGRHPNVPKHWSLEAIEQKLLPHIAVYTQGGQLVEWTTEGDELTAFLAYDEAQMHAYRDLEGRALLNPRLRERRIPDSGLPAGASRKRFDPRASIAEQWFQLGLIDQRAKPTRRGLVFSFFNHGEGLAIAAALENLQYPIEELIFDLANIRAGHRFEAIAAAGRTLAQSCEASYGTIHLPGYLRRGLPEDYGEGASEVMLQMERDGMAARHFISDELSRGDIERARLEWRSLRSHVAHAPDLDWDRWIQLKAACLASLADEPQMAPFATWPELTPQQRNPDALLLQP